MAARSMTPDQILDELETLFPDAHCELVHETPFQLLVAVVLSAQTTDASVNRVTPDLFAKWPDAASLQHAPLEEVESVLRRLGLYRTKSKNIIALSRELMDRFDGTVPQSFKDLESLPGVGRKTANVVRSVAFDIPSMAVDTHVERVSKRLGLAQPEDDPRKVEEKLRRKLPRARWNRAHHELIFFGRYFCTARKPKCEDCPFASFCKKSRVEAYQALQKEKKMTSKSQSLKTIAKNTVEEVRIFTEEANAVVDEERALEQTAKNVDDQARVLAQAQNALDNAAEEKPFVPSREEEGLFDEVRALVEAANAMDSGWEKAEHEHLRHLDEAGRLDEWNPEAVIDEKIKEEQDKEVSSTLKDELAEELEG